MFVKSLDIHVTAKNKRDAIRKFKKTEIEQTYLRPDWKKQKEKRQLLDPNCAFSYIRHYPEVPEYVDAAHKAWITIRKNKIAKANRMKLAEFWANRKKKTFEYLSYVDHL